jgi:predicted AlkP superfamily pyrophosphatase or phosphodiesterase
MPTTTPVAVILIVALTERMLTPGIAPKLSAFRDRNTLHTLRPPLPAVTCSSQSDMLTGTTASTHGIVGNGWYDRESAEVRFWKQSNRIVRAEKVWETARRIDPGVTCAKMFWWYNMHSTAEWSVTPRPIYKADGRKLPDVYADPDGLRESLQRELGPFPLFRFWGPAADISSSAWIAEASKHVFDANRPTLNLVYLPHLDYALQKFGPDAPESSEAIAEIDAVAGDLIEHYERAGVKVMVCSEYGIDPVTDAVAINRELRKAGLLRVRVEDGLDMLDPGGSRAFAVCDHQVAHVYVRDERDLKTAQDVCERTPGVEALLDDDAMREAGIHHLRSGDLLLVSAADRWFSHDYWLDDAKAPDFARTVEIHRKPGYDPRELFIDPAIRAPKLALGSRLLKKKLGFRTLMDVIPLDPTLVKGSHGRVDPASPNQPVLIGPGDAMTGTGSDAMPMTGVRDTVLRAMLGDGFDPA